MQTNPMYQSIPVYAVMAANNEGIKTVVKKGLTTESITADGHMVIPARDPQDAVETQAMLGWTLHGIGHIKYESDFTFSGNTPAGAKLYNYVEDIRIDSLAVAEKPGAVARFQGICELWLREGNFELPTDPSPSQALDLMLFYLSFHLVGSGNPIASHLANLRLRVNRILGEALVTAICTEVASVIRNGNTQASKRAVLAIERLLKDAQDMATQSSDPQGSNDDAEPSDGSDHQQPNERVGTDDSTGSNEATALDDSDDDPDLDDLVGGADSNHTDGSGSASLVAAIQDVLSQSEATVTRDQAIANAVDRMPESGDDDVKEAVLLTQLPTPDQFIWSCIDGTEVLDDGKAIGVGIRNNMRAFIEAQVREKRWFGHTGAKLNVERLHGLRHGNTRIFEKRSETNQVDTDVVIVIDQSSSMNFDRRIAVSSRATVALATAVEAVNANVAIVGYGGVDNTDVYKTFDVSLSASCAQRLEGSMGYTPSDKGLMLAGSLFKNRCAPRKVLLHVTDGMPDCNQSARAAMDYLLSQGIVVETFTIGAFAHAEQVYGKVQPITDLNTMQSELFAAVRRLAHLSLV